MMVTLATAPDAARAHMLVSLLDSRGVDARVVGENTAGFGPIGGMAVVSVMVRLGDYTRGVEELKSFLVEREPAGHDSGEAEGAPNRRLPSCPACGYSMHGLGGRTRCPECGVDQDALARVRHWVQLAPPPRELSGRRNAEHAFEASGALIGVLVLALAFFGLVSLLLMLRR